MSPGYIPAELRRLVRADAHYLCGYCHTPEALIGTPLEFEHLIPEALGGPTTRENLWLSCSRCNDFKGDRIDAVDPLTHMPARLFHPRTDDWNAHFAWSPDGIRLLGITPNGRATVAALRMNNDFIVVTRRFWVAAGWWPPASDHVLYRDGSTPESES